jgi:hypothetical protein
MPKAFFRKQETPKKGHAAARKAADDTPENPKSFFLKTRNPQKGTCRGRMAADDTPENPKSFFLKTRNPKKGTCARLVTPPKTRKAFFRKQETPKKGHAHAVCAPFAPISQSWSQIFKNDFQFYETMYALVKMAQKKFRNLPSDARFCAKRFRHIDFWTFFLSIF